jgi:Phasin protein
MSTTTPRNSANHTSPPHPVSHKEEKMNGRTPRATTSSNKTTAVGGALTPWSFLSDFGRQQAAAAAENTGAFYRARENLRKIQQKTAHEASVRHSDAAKKLSAPCEPADVWPIQAELLRGNLQGAAFYWQELAAAAMQMQREMIANMSRMVESEKGAGVKSALDAFQATIPAMANSFFVHGSDRHDEQEQQDYERARASVSHRH